MNSNSTRRNKNLISEAKEGLSKLKIEAASEIGFMDYENINKGKLSSRENGRIGGVMVKKMIESYERGIKK